MSLTSIRKTVVPSNCSKTDQTMSYNNSSDHFSSDNLDIISLIYLVLPEHLRKNNFVIGFRSVFVGIEQNLTGFNWNYPYPIGSDWDIWTWDHTCKVLPRFDVRKAENYLEKTDNDKIFTVKKQKICFWCKIIFNLVSVW
jgi:hypothetical protein